MKSVICQRVLFSLTMFAVLSMIGSESYARGRGGGGRSSGGRSSAAGAGKVSPRSSGRSSRAGDSVSKPGNLAGQLGGQAAGAGNLSARDGGLSSALADKSQLQSLSDKQPGQLTGKLSEQSGQFQQNAQSKVNQFQNKSQPFTASWYADHPNAWQATHPHADAAVVASTAAVAAWVGAGYYAPASSEGSSTTIIYQEAPEEAAPEEATNAISAAPATLQNVSPAQAANAEEWFQVGIYRLATTKESPALLMLQLVVDHQGQLRGVYYDTITDTSHNIVGTLNKSTQIAQWHLESSEQVVFQTSLNELTQPTGKLQVNLPTGSQHWLLARVEE